MKNINVDVVNDFGEEWKAYDQNDVSLEELQGIFVKYFSLFPWEKLSKEAVGFDLGCGSGRWAAFVARRVGLLHCIDPSKEALSVAEAKLAAFRNCKFHQNGVDTIPFPDNSMDFGYSLGVLHHVPDTPNGLANCVRKLKPGAPFLVYLYYALDNRPLWFRAAWYLSDLLRRVVAQLPFRLKYFVCILVASFIYFPLARFSRLAELMGVRVENYPLAEYRQKSFYTMRTDALDRFGTKLEQRFSRIEIEAMMVKAGLTGIKFREEAPFWCAVGQKR
jgi:ubiquinone/menaquinone biosynthesis C-methylase UbiE